MGPLGLAVLQLRSSEMEAASSLVGAAPHVPPTSQTPCWDTAELLQLLAVSPASVEPVGELK